MILVDHQIIRWAGVGGGVTPFTVETVNPASLDFRLGSSVVVAGETSPVRMARSTPEKPYLMAPGLVYLFGSLEAFDFSSKPDGDCLSAQMLLKSSAARAGLMMVGGGWVDCGYRGVLTLAATNISPDPIELWHGRRIAQLVVHAHARPMAEYSGRYQGSAEAVASRDG